MTLIFRKKYVSRYMTYTQQQQQNADDGCLYDKKIYVFKITRFNVGLGRRRMIQLHVYRIPRAKSKLKSFERGFRRCALISKGGHNKIRAQQERRFINLNTAKLL